jgi:hypothetical protein
MAKTNVKGSSVQIVIHSSDGKDAALASSSGQSLAITGNVVAKTATVHGDLGTNTGTHVIFDNPA